MRAEDFESTPWQTGNTATPIEDFRRIRREMEEQYVKAMIPREQLVYVTQEQYDKLPEEWKPFASVFNPN